MERITLKNVSVSNSVIDQLPVFLDDSGNIVILPVLWSLHMNLQGITLTYSLESSSRFHKRKPETQDQKLLLKENPISDKTITSLSWHLFRFLNYIEQLSIDQKSKTPSVHNTELVSIEFLNYYLNEVVPKNTSSPNSLKIHQSALSSYYNFLSYMEITHRLPTTIYRKTRRKLALQDIRSPKIQYISRDHRSSLIRACKTKRDKLILRMGFEVGLRAEENMGLVLDPIKAKGNTYPGLLSLFEAVNNEPDKNQYKYMLSGGFTKGGKSRFIYFDKNLIESMIEYYETERNQVIQDKKINRNTFFLRSDPAGRGKPIAAHQASKLFHRLKQHVEYLNPNTSYHDLRHTFATELYHQEQFDDKGYETRSESTALIKLQERLGHSSSSSTKLYVHLRQQLLEIEIN